MKKENIDIKTVQSIKEFSNPKDITFGKTLVPGMLNCYYHNNNWGDLSLIPYQMLQIDPAAKVLHYAQEIFEGLKAYKNPNGEVYLFRPEENAKRFNLSAQRIGMPEICEKKFIDSLEVLCRVSANSISTKLGDSFYLRPFMFGDEPQLGVKPSSTYQYYLIGGPAGDYFTNKSVKVRVEREEHRAAAKGTGVAKTGGNYAASLGASLKSNRLGFDQTLWLDPTYSKYIEEFSGMNFFAMIDGVLTTPPLGGSILHGITRDTLLKLAGSIGIETCERPIEIDELMNKIKTGDCSEAFACGTASVLTPIGLVSDNGIEAELKFPEGKISSELKDLLLMIQAGRREDPFGWRHPVSLEE